MLFYIPGDIWELAGMEVKMWRFEKHYNLHCEFSLDGFPGFVSRDGFYYVGFAARREIIGIIVWDWLFGLVWWDRKDWEAMRD